MEIWIFVHEKCVFRYWILIEKACEYWNLEKRIRRTSNGMWMIIMCEYNKKARSTEERMSLYKASNKSDGLMSNLLSFKCCIWDFVKSFLSTLSLCLNTLTYFSDFATTELFYVLRSQFISIFSSILTEIGHKFGWLLMNIWDKLI